MAWRVNTIRIMVYEANKIKIATAVDRNHENTIVQRHSWILSASEHVSYLTANAQSNRLTQTDLIDQLKLTTTKPRQRPSLMTILELWREA